MKKIQFFNTYPGVIETFPIEQGTKALPKWVKSARDSYVQNKEPNKNHLYRCPGIADIYKTGFVVRAWHDFSVEADDDDVHVNLPSESLSNISVDVHKGDMIARFLPKRHYSSISVIKLNTPWHVISPVKLMVVPFPYPDHSDLEACGGILDPSISTEVNIQIYWNRPNSKTYVQAGTPLCLLIPLSEDTYEIELRYANDKDKEWLTKKHYLNTMSFITPFRKMKDLYEKMWNLRIK